MPGSGPSTEDRNPASRGLDTLAALEVVRLMHTEDKAALSAVEAALPAIAEAAEDAARAVRGGGVVCYAGAGTSGRLGVLDASEIMPTFGSRAFRALIAGGEKALTEAVEGAEDDQGAGAEAAGQLGPADMALGISASGSTPFVLGFLKEARKRGTRTWMLTCSSRKQPFSTDGLITLPTGPELIAGSTRLKAGTATKMALNMISTTAMVILGGTHDGLMVDVVPANSKLIERARRIVMEITGAKSEEASAALRDSAMNPKAAALMLMRGLTKEAAHEALEKSGGSLRKALG